MAWIAVTAVVCFCLGIGVVMLLQSLQSKPTPDLVPTPTPDSSPVNQPLPTVLTTPATTPSSTTQTGTVYAVRGTNIVALNLNGEAPVQLTNYPESPPVPSDDSAAIGRIENLHVIDRKTLGFSRCVTVTDNFGCTIHTLNLVDNSVSTILALEPAQNLLSLDIASPYRYGYLIQTDTNWQLVVHDREKVRILEDLSSTQFGRGGFVEDSDVLSFSPDATYLMQISTSSPRDPADFNIYVYNVSGKTKTVISEATQPVWFNNHTIAYRKYQNGIGGDGLWMYDVTSQKNEKVQGVEKDAYRPQVLPGKPVILYERYPAKQTMAFTLQTNSNELIAASTVFPVWIDDTTIAATVIQSCAPTDDSCGISDYLEKAVGIYTLPAKTKTGELTAVTHTVQIATPVYP